MLPAAPAARAAPTRTQIRRRGSPARSPQGRQIQIGVFGDSFGDGVWAGLYNQLRGDAASRSTNSAERSTGFTRYRSLNLLDDIRAKLDRQPVDIAVLSFGANDTQGIFVDGHGNRLYERGLAADRDRAGHRDRQPAARARRPGLLGRPAEDARRRSSTPTSRR